MSVFRWLSIRAFVGGLAVALVGAACATDRGTGAASAVVGAEPGAPAVDSPPDARRAPHLSTTIPGRSTGSDPRAEVSSDAPTPPAAEPDDPAGPPGSPPAIDLPLPIVAPTLLTAHGDLLAAAPDSVVGQRAARLDDDTTTISVDGASVSVAAARGPIVTVAGGGPGPRGGGDSGIRCWWGEPGDPGDTADPLGDLHVVGVRPVTGETYLFWCSERGGGFVVAPAWRTYEPGAPGGGVTTGIDTLPAALDALGLAAPELAFSPPDRAIVGKPVYLAATNDLDGGQARAQVGGAPWVWSHATASLASVTWDLGDGHTVVCPDAGTLYDADLGGPVTDQPPTCGHTYLDAGSYAVTVTATWDVTWSSSDNPAVAPWGQVQQATVVTRAAHELEAVIS